MGSRYGGYGGDHRSPHPPPPPASHAPSGGGRWDADRFARESRGPPVMERERFEERDRYYDDRYREREPERFRPPPERFEERTVYEERERYAPPPRRAYYEEEEIDFRRAPPAGAMVPYRREEPPPPRPGLLRRQSSLDFYDRKPQRRFDQVEPEYRIPIRVPPRRPSPPRYQPRYIEKDFEEIRVAEPDLYGDEEYRNIREREWTTSRRRQRSRSRSSSGGSSVTEKAEEVEKPFPRKGKTRMPKRLVHTRAIIELGYPYEEEGEVIVIQKALGKDNIDEVVNLSKTFKAEDEKSTTYVFERAKAKSPKPETVIEEKISHLSMAEAPRSVREWDTLKVKERSPSPASTHRSHKTRHSSHHSSRHRSHSHVTSSRREHSPNVVEEIIEKREIREVSPSHHSHHSHHSRRRSSPREVIERREIIEDIGESNSIHAGPLALVVPERRHKSDVQITDEIRALERERRALREERIERVRPVQREVIIERDGPEIIEVKKDRKAPDPRIIRAMMATLT